MPQKLRLAFMGTPDFAAYTLRALKDAGHEIAAVYTQPPKPAGRGQQVKKSPVHEAAEAMGVAVRTPKNLREPEEQAFLKNLGLDAIVVVAYGVILPQSILDAPKFGCINVHFSLLPRWRGAMPVQHAILNGDRETGIDIMQMAADLDTGDILVRETVPVTDQSTAPALLEDLGKRGARLVLLTLAGLAAGKMRPAPQPEEGATYARKLTREDGRIDWAKSAVEIERQIRALNPWPGCFFILGAEPIKLLAAQVVEGQGTPGTLLDDRFTVACGQGALRLLSVQRAGKNPTDGASFLRGARLATGQSI